ncbi:urease accessory protein UreE [Providencia manganoxydans]|uniref:urease accessory protein UreE n=1 Tax=Providencia manganoxydans TaxID=2923283 RepID=UPI00281036D6|nr:urease accessory protein UreE [Providencia stuartii]ELR5080940.1 urease accessory protein UreE [Providencia stuartii]
MIIIEQILGNVKKDPVWQEKSQKAQLDVLILDQREAQKSRCRKHTEKGLDLGIALDRNVLLSDGDVILFDEAANTMVIVQISLRDVMVVNLQRLQSLDAEEQIRVSFELGHALGNQHWKAVLKENQVYVPLTVSEKVMESVMRTHGFSQDTFAFVKGESILPKLTHSEARLLFGGAEDTDTHVHVAIGQIHQHAHSHSHDHDHDHHHDHDHDHHHGHNHTHKH